MKLISLSGAAIAVVLTSCATTNSNQAATPAAVAADDAASNELKEHHRHHHHGGITQFISMSLDTLGHEDAKAPQIEKIQGDLRTCMKPAREINRNLIAVIADGVAAGTVDTVKVETTIAQLTPAAITERDCSIVALNQLHEVLSPPERQALVDKVDAHWQVWREENHEAEAGARDRGSRLSELQRELKLTPDQVDKMSAGLTANQSTLKAKFEQKKVEDHMEAFGKAFVGDKFDAKNITVNANAHLATHGAERMAQFYETVTPMLTAEQRTTLAAHLKEYASHQPAVAER